MAPSARWLANQSLFDIVMEANAPGLARDLALQGIGHVVSPCFIDDRRPNIVQVHPRIAELAHDQWLVSHHKDRFIPPLHQVLDDTYKFLNQTIKSSIEPE